ncbi:uncharacterized protein LOC134765873 [Penaeus indicus]|uniref:uncharacterized protein LOC134765873 n=1 Tax=Penaeus indicus TaxID=29960 RepID=UPI00300CC916
MKAAETNRERFAINKSYSIELFSFSRELAGALFDDLIAFFQGSFLYYVTEVFVDLVNVEILVADKSIYVLDFKVKFCRSGLQVIGRVDGYLLPELTEAQLARKIACCRDLLKVLDVLDPGISRLRGLTLYELHAPLLITANRAFQETTLRKSQFLEKLHEAEGYLERTVYCLQFEPNSSVEGQICKIARGSLVELKTWIQTVKELPVSHFLPEEEEETKPQYTEEDLTLETLLKKLEEQ